MALTFDATLKDMGRDSPRGFLAAFDRPPAGPVRPLNIDLSTVTTAADLILGQRLLGEAPPNRAKKLLTDALLLTGLRVRRDVAARIFRGVRAMEESDTYLMILDQGQEKHAKKAVLLVGEERLGPPDESVKAHLDGITDLEHLDRMLRRAAKAVSWKEILDTP